MHQSHGISRRLALAFALLCLAMPALPQTESYTIEIVVFRNGGDTGALADTEASPLITGDDVIPASVAARKLAGSIARLNNSGRRVLGHAAWRQAPTEFGEHRGVSAARLGLAGMSGKVFFERGDYMHLGIDLVIEDGGKRYRISEIRKQVRADEIHYFDHPAVGVLAVVGR